MYENFNLIHVDEEDYDDNYFLNNYGKIPDYIIGYESFKYPKNKSIKILITEDLHLKSLDLYDNLFQEVDIILPKFNIINNLFNNKFKSKIIEFPLYCSNSFLIKNINYNAENKIAMYGNLNIEQYHLRNKWFNYMNNNFKDIFNLVNGTTSYTSNELRKYSFGLVVGYTPKMFENINEKKNGYVVAKYFEVCGSGLLLLADTTDIKDEFTKYGFIDNVNYIDVTFQNINDKVKFIINDKNKEKINSIRLNGHNLIKSHHLISNRINMLKKILKPINL
jgi:hypothetical protein